MEGIAITHACSTFTTASIPDFEPGVCVVQICTVPGNYLYDPFLGRHVVRFHVLGHFLSPLVLPEDWLRLSISDPRYHTNLRYGARHVEARYDNVNVQQSPALLMDEFLNGIKLMANKVQSYCEAGYHSSLAIIVCGPTSLRQDVIRELPCPLTVDTELQLLTLEEIRRFIKWDIGVTFMTPSMVCDGWVINQSLGNSQFLGNMDKASCWEMMLGRIGRNLAPLYKDQANDELLGPNSAINQEGRSLISFANTVLARKVLGVISKTCDASCSIAPQAPVFNLHKCLDDWVRLCGDRLGAPLMHFWAHMQLLGPAKAHSIDTPVARLTQAQLLILLAPAALTAQGLMGPVDQLFGTEHRMAWRSLNAHIDQVISGSAHRLAMENLAELLLSTGVHPIHDAYPDPLKLSQPTWSTEDERNVLKAIADLFPPTPRGVSAPGSMLLVRYIWGILQHVYRNSPDKKAAIDARISIFQNVVKTIRVYLMEELLEVPAVALAAFDFVKSLGLQPNVTLLHAREVANIVDTLGTELFWDSIESRRSYHS
ncbi:hypothetical protein FZEAL_9380 [Fusarium zealandicum]|uniref:Uncharacterized protein n=1 Tax=Fusarium zealandicum TaxID=1053134 RepID=A0A8H4UB88_9HYPO|nr:hypothetical protein FZEAL_9380 [Fusarium zealandicum]